MTDVRRIAVLRRAQARHRQRLEDAQAEGRILPDFSDDDGDDGPLSGDNGSLSDRGGRSGSSAGTTPRDTPRADAEAKDDGLGPAAAGSAPATAADRRRGSGESPFSLGARLAL
jgi:hypothetical protein